MSDTVIVPAEAPWLEGAAVLARLRELDHETWFVGGCVRDLLLGRPVHDVDLATGATPDQVEAAFDKTVAVGKSFGVVVVVTPSGDHVEVASFRSDGAYIDGRRPTAIHLSTAVADVERRDFTINALLMGPDGVIVDHVGGRRDLSARTIRGVGNAPARLAEDRLRVLRALRFAARMDLAIAPDTWAAVRSISLIGLSAERIIQEWDKALAELAWDKSMPISRARFRGRFLRLCAASGRLAEITPPLADASPATIAATATALDRLPINVETDAAMALWLASADPAQAARWLAGQPLERARVRTMTWLLQNLAAWRKPADPWQAMSVAERRRLAMHPDATGLWLALSALDTSPPAESSARAFGRALDCEWDAGTAQGQWKPLIRGDDLKTFGIAPGPEFGRWLRRVEDAELEGAFTDRTGGLAWLAEARQAP